MLSTPRPIAFILIHCLIWWIMIVAAKSVLDRYGDMMEVYGWSQHWLAGSSKHPQLLPWIAKVWFMVAPKTVASFFLLSALNLAVALLGILALGRALGLGERALMVAVALSTLALPYLTLADTLNMNAICLSVWPWVAWAFVKVVEPEVSEGRRRAYGALFGLLAGLSILGKYYSIVLLIPLFAYSLTPACRAIWRGGAPWIAMGVALVTLTPHVLWLTEHREALAFATEQSGGDLGRWLYRMAKFALAPLIYWPIPILLAFLLLASGSLRARAARLLRWPAGSGLLGVVAAGPLVTTIVFSMLGIVELSIPWAIPIGFAFTLWLAANADPAALERNGLRLVRAFRGIWPAMIAAGVAMGAISGWVGEEHFYTPYAEAAEAVAGHWAERDAAVPDPWIVDHRLAAALAFFAPRPLEALTAVPDAMPPYYPLDADWRSRPGVIVCSLAPAGEVDRDCLERGLRWAREHDLSGEVATVELRRTGVRFPKEIPFTLAVVYIGAGDGAETGVGARLAP